MSKSSLIDEAFGLLREASDLEEESDHNSSVSKLQQSASKYNEACFLMKRHVRNESNGDSSSAKMKQLLVEKIDHYEMHAVELLEKVKMLKLTNSQRQQEQQNTSHTVDGDDSQIESNHRGSSAENKNLNNRSSNSSWEISHSLHIHSANNITEETNDTGTMNNVNKYELEEVTQVEGKAGRLLDCGIDHDERGETIEALQFYVQAAECYSHAISLLKSPSQRGGQHSSEASEVAPTSTIHKERVASLERKRNLTINRVNELKNRITSATETSSTDEPSVPKSISKSTAINKAPGYNDDNKIQPDKLTPYEIKVLTWSSHIASGVFLPWSDEEARTYNYSSDQPWKDPAGPLPLSDKQKTKFHKWARPSDIITMGKSKSGRKITMINSITPYTIKQYCVSDCSFIAGLCISAAFERRFNRRLVSSLIYPQDETTGMPIYNPSGVYMVKLWLNGVERRVLVDDMFPVDARGKLLCSHTKTANGSLELWVPILEKAYMKLCGGYDFPGSNSGVDLFSLTGWIPERLFFPEDPSNVLDFETPVERAWERLFSANSYGDCLITVSTSKDLSEAEAGKVGLFTGHAYAVLGVVQTSNGTRLLQLKNPWASQGWKGRFSPQDKDSWGDSAFCTEVGYDAVSASQYDDGVFWMAWDDVLLYFRNMHLSWSRELFSNRTAVHGFWNKETGPIDDSFNVGENPQYTVTLSEKAIQSKATLWLLLSRHVTKQEQEGGEVTDYLTMHIHRIKHPKQRVWYPDANLVLSGAYTNNQHVLVRYDADGNDDRYLSIILSQYKKSNDLGYTLSCFCTEKFELLNSEKLAICCPLAGSWKLRDSSSDQERLSLDIGTAGGPPGKGSFGSNPQWSVRIPSDGIQIQIKSMVPKDIAVNVILCRSKPSSNTGSQTKNEQRSRRVHHLYHDPIIDTGSYRHGFAVSDAVFVPAGLYTLVASTFDVGQEASFFVHVLSSQQIHISELD